MKIAIVNGPNLNLLGIREPHIYGNTTFDDVLLQLHQQNKDISISYYQSNIEGELINYLHECMGKIDGILLNAGAYTHTSIALADAVSSINIPVVEIHISNILAREEYRKTSYIASKCVGSISGLGIYSYQLGIDYFKQYLSSKSS